MDLLIIKLERDGMNRIWGDIKTLDWIKSLNKESRIMRYFEYWISCVNLVIFNSKSKTMEDAFIQKKLLYKFDKKIELLFQSIFNLENNPTTDSQMLD